MARKTARPGRTLVVFFLAMAIAYGLVALAGTWKPTLGLDLQGGTSITLRAEGDPGEEALDQARQIIDDRVNGSGVAEAEVTTQGGNEIVVEIPGENARNLIETVQRTAQLRFRLVACSTVDGRCATSTGLPEGIQIDPSTTLPQEDGDQGEGNNRAALGSWARLSDTGSDGGDNGNGGADDGQDQDAGEGAQGNGGNGGKQSAYDACIAAAADDKTAAKPLEWIDNPTTACVDAFSEFQASGGCQQGASAAMGDDPATPLITCDEDGIAYLLSPAMIEGTSLDDAGAAIPQQQVNYVVTLSFDGEGTEVFADISNALVGTEKQFAIVLDGQVLSAPTMEGRILDGNAQISGDFSETSANSLATSLRYGSLPIAFEDQPLVETIGPSLAGDQLSAGLTAGGIGLAIVMLYCLLYYRGLGTVVIASLFVAAGITYAMVLLLSETANFTLTLPGIAGIIVAVGITADSFIVYFERIRDEMRIGKSMKVAVEAGWKRARNTCVAADAVSLLAAVVLYIFAAGVVKGFAFALGLTTIIDLVVFFWFTHPMVSWLAKYRFFNKGHRLSGLSPETLGVARTATGGNA